MLLQSPDNPDGIPAAAAAESRATMIRDIGDWMEMSGKAEYFSGEHRVSHPSVHVFRRAVVQHYPALGAIGA